MAEQCVYSSTESYRNDVGKDPHMRFGKWWHKASLRRSKHRTWQILFSFQVETNHKENWKSLSQGSAKGSFCAHHSLNQLTQVSLPLRHPLHTFRGCLRLFVYFHSAQSIHCLGSSNLLFSLPSNGILFSEGSFKISVFFMVSVSLLSALLAFFQFCAMFFHLVKDIVCYIFAAIFSHLSQTSLCYPSHLQALCYFLTFSEISLMFFHSLF